MSSFPQLAFYLPSLVAHVVALAIAAAVFPRAKLPALLLAGGTALQLAASCASFGMYAWSVSAYESMAISDVSVVMGAGGLLTSLIRALGEILVAGAVAAAAFTLGRPAPGATDPYGYPPSP
ncbi:MAG: hypothetical protein ACK4YP_21130 [Myxococcota bacterium]